MGEGGPGKNSWDSGPPGGSSPQPPSHPSAALSTAIGRLLPTLGGGSTGPSELSFPHPTGLTSQGAGASPLFSQYYQPLGPRTPPPPPWKPLQVGGRGRRSKCKGSRCWSLSFIFGGGEGEELKVGACLGTPPGPSVVEVGWGRRHGPWGMGQKGLSGGSERPKLKAWLPPQIWALWHPIARPIIWGGGRGQPCGR